MSKLCELRLCYNEEYFTVCVDQETHDELVEDEQKLTTYTKEIYEMLHRNENNDACISDTNDTSIKIRGEEGKTSFKWTHAITLMLVETRLQKENDFNRPVCKKKKLWTTVAEEINKIAKCNITGDMCDIKYRNLLATYKSNKKRSQQSGETSITWEYFELFDKVLGKKASVMPSLDIIGDVESISMDKTDTLNQHNEYATDSESSNCSEIGKKDTKIKKRKPTTDIGQYLYEKQKVDREKRLEREARDEKRWKEKKEIKEREINALEKLADAIARQYNK